MTKTIKLALVAAMALGTTSAFATNGSALIGTGAKARGMAGVGIGMAHGAESALVNPALISSVEGTEVQFGGTIFMPDVKNENSLVLPTGPAGGTPTGQTDASSSATSKANMSVIPAVSLATKVNDNFYWGVGMWGTAGMGVDYRDAENTGQLNMVTNLQLMQFGVPLVYANSGFSVGITPVLQYGALDINYVMSADLQNAMYYMQTGTMGGATMPMTVGSGVGQDLKFGVNVGLAYQIAGVTIGASYKSKINMEYDGVLSTAAGAMTGGVYKNDKLSTPAEIGAGVSYTFSGNTIALDYKQIKWSDAEGYKDFAWDDQNVISIGYEYAADVWAVRVGYNHASSPISEQMQLQMQTD
jgi:long-chain fatty acid transport protein